MKTPGVPLLPGKTPGAQGLRRHHGTWRVDSGDPGAAWSTDNRQRATGDSNRSTKPSLPVDEVVNNEAVSSQSSACSTSQLLDEQILVRCVASTERVLAADATVRISIFIQMPSISCHGRWCPVVMPGFENPDSPNCTDVTQTFKTSFSDNWFTYTGDYDLNLACCKLYCDQSSNLQNQFLILQCQGTSVIIAILVWVMVPFLVLCALASLISLAVERAGRAVAMAGGGLFVSYISVSVYMYSPSRGDVAFDTPLYPIVGAMSVVAFSYFFAGFQYSIGFQYELAATSALVIVMFPLWTLLTVKMDLLMAVKLTNSSTESAMEAARLVLAMLIISVLWTVHSSLYRTVGYKAAWISALTNQKDQGELLLPHSTNCMSNLWILSAAQGHPTWRTPTGQSIALSLTALSWGVLVKCRAYLQHECKDDFVLFHMMLWTPPVILTMALLATQVKMFLGVPCDSQGRENSLFQWLKAEIQSVRRSGDKFQEAMTSYRLGRDSLEVESNIDQFQSKFDKPLANALSWIETAIYVVFSPGTLALQIFQWIVRCGLKGTSTFKRFGDWQKSQPTLKTKIRAFRILCENCHSEGIISLHYNENRGVLSEKEVDDEVCRILKEQRRHIRLPLLLDNISPSGLRYMLQQLDVTLNIAAIDEDAEDLELNPVEHPASRRQDESRDESELSDSDEHKILDSSGNCINFKIRTINSFSSGASGRDC